MGKFVVKDAARSSENGVNPVSMDDAGTDSIFSSDVPSDIIFPDQLNRYFRDQIHSLTLENGGLRRSLEEIQEQLSSARDKLTKMVQPTPTGRVAEMADYKIAQLSKRLREQNAEMESLRTQTREAEAKLRRMEERNVEDIVVPATPDLIAEKDKQIKALTDKLQASNGKICDFRNQYQALKQELKLAQKVIESEIGEKCSLQDLAKENGSWRGRAQQILALQNKVQVLQEQLNNTNSTDNPAASLLRQIEKDRRASYEETSKQLNQKTIQMEELRKKLEAARARNKVLESEIIQVKTKMATLMEKSSKDEQILAALTSQINAFEDRGKAQIQCFSKMQENMTKVQQELELERTKGEQLQRALSDREARIRRMEEQIDELRKNLKNKRPNNYDDDDHEGLYMMEDKSTYVSLSADNVNSMNVTDTERKRLTELLGVINKRLEEARKEQYEKETQLRKEKCKTAKLEKKIARLELEKVGAMKIGRGSYSYVNNKPIDSFSAEDIDFLARQHIEYLEEECLALKTRIETLQMEKEADLKMIACFGEGSADSHGDGKLPRSNARVPLENCPTNRALDRKLMNRKKIQRSPARTVRTGNLVQSSFSSEEFKY